jgi:NAD(P)-dependent dehydrogenase (short-subunit alcohol dehydrogenase family)
MDLKGKAALVTGGASGIGAEAARRLTAAGARVAVADLDEARTRALADEIGGLALPGDAAQPDTMTMAVDIAEDTFGRLDIVLLNAGITAGQSGIENLDLAGYRKIMGVNVDHVVFGLTAAVPALRRAGGGTIIATASLAGLTAMPGDALYTLSKHAVVGYVRSAAPTLAAENIRVNAVCPGFADTPLLTPAKGQLGDFPLLTPANVVDAIFAILDRGEPGECWFVQPGREPAPYGFRGVPGPKGSPKPPDINWQSH